MCVKFFLKDLNFGFCLLTLHKHLYLQSDHHLTMHHIDQNLPQRLQLLPLTSVKGLTRVSQCQRMKQSFALALQTLVASTYKVQLQEAYYIIQRMFGQMDTTPFHLILVIDRIKFQDIRFMMIAFYHQIRHQSVFDISRI